MLDRQHGLGQKRGGFAGALLRLLGRLLGGLAAALRLFERAAGRGLGELAGDEEVPQIAGRDVDGVPGLAEVLNVFEENRLRHRSRL